mmetsp:Transcript_19740/g.43151  ORF Transcript_19740/g.43151 Transcript_19740/m.43151 type:complete len:442 (-) Transcript_19740:519-1844(-)
MGCFASKNKQPERLQRLSSQKAIWDSTAFAEGDDNDPHPDTSVHSISSVEALYTVEELTLDTHFSENEIAALYTFFQKVSNTLVEDGLIHAEEFQLALFGESKGHLFADRVFTIINQSGDGAIAFEEFVRALSVFHPSAAVEEKARFAFMIYDLNNTGFIDKGEVRYLLKTMITDNPSIKISEQALEEVLDKTFREVDLAGDGVISMEEWQDLCRRKPAVLTNMTLEPLMDLTLRYPSFVFNKCATNTPNIPETMYSTFPIRSAGRKIGSARTMGKWGALGTLKEISSGGMSPASSSIAVSPWKVPSKPLLRRSRSVHGGPTQGFRSGVPYLENRSCHGGSLYQATTMSDNSTGTISRASRSYHGIPHADIYIAERDSMEEIRPTCPPPSNVPIEPRRLTTEYAPEAPFPRRSREFRTGSVDEGVTRRTSSEMDRDSSLLR